MAKKRGGLAGIWDRNKKVIKSVAPVALAMLPGVGPLASAALGGAMNGLDRPGKGGIGFDVGAGLKGAAAGYGQGMLGNGLQDALGAGIGAGKTAGTAGKGLLGQIGAGLKTGGAALVPQVLDAAKQGANGLPGLDLLGGGGGAGGDGVPGWMKALAGAQIANAAALQSKANDFANNAYKDTKNFWDQRSGLRSGGISGMQAGMAPTPMPQLGKIGAAGNPFANG